MHTSKELITIVITSGVLLTSTILYNIHKSYEVDLKAIDKGYTQVTLPGSSITSWVKP